MTDVLNLKDKNKQDCLSVIIADYEMPQEDGLSFLEKYKDHTALKILLTGAAPEGAVIEAFNKGIIDFYINKSDKRFPETLFEKVRESQLKAFLNQSYSFTELLLKEDDKTLLKSSVYKHLLLDYVKNYKIKEFYLFDNIGSYFLKSETDEYVMFVTEESKNLSLVSAMEEEYADTAHKEEFKKLLNFAKKGERILFDPPFKSYDFNDLEYVKAFFRKATVLTYHNTNYFYFFSNNNFKSKSHDYCFIESKDLS